MRRHSTATLMGLTKKELVEYVRMAEHNQDVAEETLNQQAENVKDWMPVVHGRWEKDGTCTNCKGLNPTYRENKWSAQFPNFLGNFDRLNYCPNCGAKMDGGKGNDI